MKHNRTQIAVEAGADATAPFRKMSIATSVAFFAAAAAAQASGDYAPAIWRPACSGHWYTSGYGHKFHVVHDMEGYYWSAISYMQNCGTQASVHYCVNGVKDSGTDSPAGEITQMVAEAYYAWHVVCWNQHCSGTEHEGFVSNPAWFTEAQYQASAGITAHIASKFGFAKDRNHIVGHNEKSSGAWVNWAGPNLGINPTCNTHTDPGPYWDWSHYMQLVNGGGGSRPAGRNDVYVQATDNTIWGRSWVSGQGWYAWQPVGGGTYYGPSATSWGINDINVFVKGTDNQIWVDTWVGSWGGFYPIGGNPVGSPASCSQGVGNLEVFWRGTDNALWHKSYNNGWGAEESLGGSLTSEPCAVSWGAGRVDVFVRGSDNACWQLTWTSSAGWQGWWSLGGYLSGKVAAASWGSGRLDLFCRSSDNQLYHKGWQGSWYPSNTGWEALGGNCTSDPGACSYASGQIDVYVRGTDYGLWHKWFDGTVWQWSGFESLGGDFHNAPAVCSFNHAQ